MYRDSSSCRIARKFLPLKNEREIGRRENEGDRVSHDESDPREKSQERVSRERFMPSIGPVTAFEVSLVRHGQ